VECFVNSLGYSHAKRNQKTLPENDFEILNGKLKGRFLQLKSKIERYDGKTTSKPLTRNRSKNHLYRFLIFMKTLEIQHYTSFLLKNKSG